MTRLTVQAACAFLLLVTGLAMAADAPPRRTGELMQKSGLWKQVGQFQEQMRAGAAQAREQARAAGEKTIDNDADFARLTRAMDAAFEPEALRRGVSRDLARYLSRSDEDEVLVWLSSDLGKRLTTIEERAGEMDEIMKAEREAPDYLRSLPEERVDRFKRLEAAIRAGEATSGMVQGMTSAIVYGFALMSPNSDPEGAVAKLKKSLASQREQMSAVFVQRAVEAFAYVYREVPDGEIDSYIRFNSSAPGKRYNDAAMKAFENALLQSSVEMGKFFGQDASRERARKS